MNGPTFIPLGDSAITVKFGDVIDWEINRQVVHAAYRVRKAAIPGVTDVVPSYAAFSVHYDPVTIGYRDLMSRIQSTLDAPPEKQAGTSVSSIANIEVKYDGEDLEEVAKRTGLTTEDVIRIHSSTVYRVFVIGFVPGWAYLGELDQRLRLPRRESPRRRVPPGSVAIAEAQTGVYPSATPGGWHIIGTTPAKMFDPLADPPSRLRVGDQVRFEPIP